MSRLQSTPPQPGDSSAPPGAGSSVPPSPREPARIRPRVALLILLTQAILIWWTADSEITRGIYLICYTLMMPTVMYLLVARILRRWLPFNGSELLLGYIVLTATIPIIGFGGLRFVVVGMGYLPFFSQSQPSLSQYLPSLKGLPVLHDMHAITGLYTGGTDVPWAAWTLPIAFWSTYLFLLSLLWISFAAILRRIWIHQERLTFPIAVIPLQMEDRRDDLFRKRLFWYGFLIPAVLQSLLAIRQWVPSVPAIQLKATDLRPQIFNSPPWDAIPNLNVGFYPMAIGLAYFIPSDVSFSCWFLSIVMRLVYVVGAAMGLESAGTGAARFPYREEQAAGAWLAFALLILWGAHRHWKTVSSLIPQPERRELRWLSLLALGCVIGCSLMMHVAGIPVVMSTGVVLVYAAYVLSGARVRAESGGQWTFAPLFWTPDRLMNSLVGTQGLGQRSLVASGHFDLIHVDMRAQSLPYLMEGLNVAENSGIRWRTVLAWVAGGTLTALAMGWYCTLTHYYALGAATARVDDYAMLKVQTAFNEVQRLTNSPGTRDVPGIMAVLFAMALTLAMAWLRRAGLVGLHPVGYVLCNTLTMSSFVVPFFIAWLAKTVILRFFGHGTYRRSVPFFVGIALGDIVAQAVWAIIGGVFNVPIYQFLT